MTQKYLNNFDTQFIAAVKNVASSGTPDTELDYGIVRVATGAAALLGSITAGDHYILTAYKKSGTVESNVEIMKITAIDTSVINETRLTVSRAQEGTTAQSYVPGDYLSLRFTKGGAEGFAQKSNNLADLTSASTARTNLGLGSAAVEPTTSFSPASHAIDTANPHAVTKAQVGLGSVENKSSATIRSEITSGNVTTALGYTPENPANKNVASGYAGLDGAGLIPSALLPSYVDDVLEYANFAALPGTGVTGVIYVTLDTNKTYRWSGSAYVEISPSPGSTDSVTEGAVNLYFTAARAQAALSGMYLPIGGGTLTGDLALSGTGRRILGDFSNSTVASRTMFQTSTVNGSTQIGILPNGTAVNSQLHLFGASDTTNAPYGGLVINSTQMRLFSGALGTGTALPLVFYIGASEHGRLTTGGNWLIGTTTDDGSGNKLQVTGGASINGSIGVGQFLFTGLGVSTGDTSIEIGQYRTGSGLSYLDFHSTASSDYEARILRASGANGSFDITNTGTGGISVINAGAGVINLGTNNTVRAVVSAAGNFLIGSTTDDGSNKLQVTGAVKVVGTAYSPTITLTDGATINWDTSTGQVAKVTLGGNRTFAAPTNLVDGAFYSINVIQDGTGSRTATWNSVFAFTDNVAPTLSTAASATDFIVFKYDGTKLREQGRSLGVA